MPFLKNIISWVIIDSSNTSWLSWGENEKMLQSKLFGYVYDLDKDGEKSHTLKKGADYTIQQSHDRFAGMDYVIMVAVMDYVIMVVWMY